MKYQSDKVPMSEVLKDFHALPKEFQKLYAANLVTGDELNYLVKLVAKCSQFMTGVAHGLSYMPSHNTFHGRNDGTAICGAGERLDTSVMAWHFNE